MIAAIIAVGLVVTIICVIYFGMVACTVIEKEDN